MSDEAHDPGRRAQLREETLAILCSILPQDEEKLALKPILELRGEEAQEQLDILQTIADSPELSERVRFLTLKTLFLLSQASQKYPPCYEIKNLVLEKRVTGGGYGVLWKGKIAIKGEIETGIQGPHRTDYAVKVVGIFGDVKIEDCLREAVVWRQLNHPNVLPFLGMYYKHNKFNKENAYFVSPFMNNGSLSDLLKKKKEEKKEEEEKEKEDMYTLIYDIASGLKYLHDENVIHGDLKPDNVLITNDYRACLCDFGLSRMGTSRGFPSRHQDREIPDYAAPEVKRDARTSKEGDVYSFGSLCCVILQKMYPSLKRLGNNATRPENLPSEMWNMITQCLAKKASDRPNVETLLKDMSSEPKPASKWDYSDPLFKQIRSNVDHGDMPRLQSLAANQLLQ